MIWGIQPEVLVSLAINSLILVWLIVANSRGTFVWKATHLRELAALESQVERARKDRDDQVAEIRAEMNTRMENFRADHAQRMTESREDHARQLEALVKVADGIRSDFAVVLAKADRDIDQWRGAWQLTDQANREEVGAKIDELVAGFATMRRWLSEWQRVTGVPQLRRSEATTGDGSVE